MDVKLMMMMMMMTILTSNYLKVVSPFNIILPNNNDYTNENYNNKNGNKN